MREIPLKYGGYAIVDDDNYNRFMEYEWLCDSNGYAYRTGTGADGKWTSIHMHRILMWAPPGMECDHRNGNKLDNRRENLRICTPAENRRNRPAPRNTLKTSRFKGVRFNRLTGTWKATIKVDNRKILLGTFKTEEAAALAYNEGAKRYHGDFAWLNDITPNATPSVESPPKTEKPVKRRVKSDDASPKQPEVMPRDESCPFVCDECFFFERDEPEHGVISGDGWCTLFEKRTDWANGCMRFSEASQPED
jgi:hypothetical protein